MLIKDLQNCKKFLGRDNTLLKELLHPSKENLKLNYSLAHAVLMPGESSLPHKLKSSEVYYIIEGKGIMHINNESAEVHSGHAIYIPPDSEQRIQNTGDSYLKFLCIVEPAWKQEDEEIL